MKKLRVGVVGVGHIGSNHARIYAELPHAEFVAAFDIDPGRAAEIAATCKTKAVESLNEFAEMVDAASVATPTNAHFSVARDLLARGKHVLIEKPITEIRPTHASSHNARPKNGWFYRLAMSNASIPFLARWNSG